VLSWINQRQFRAAAFFAFLAACLPCGVRAEPTAPSWVTPVDLSDLPPYKPAIQVGGVIRMFGGYMKDNMILLEHGFLKFHPDADFANNFAADSEGAIAGLYTGIADMGPSGDPCTVADKIAYFNTFHSLPLEMAIATGGYDVRASLSPPVIFVNKANPIRGLSIRQLDRIFGAERTGGWDGITFTTKYARGPETNIRKWGQLGLTGEWADKAIQTYAPPPKGGIPEVFEAQMLHGSQKWNPATIEFGIIAPRKDVSPPSGTGTGTSLTWPGKIPPVGDVVALLQKFNADKYAIGLGDIWPKRAYTLNHPVNGERVWQDLDPVYYPPDVRMAAISAEDGGPYYEPTPENIRKRIYPLVRDVTVYLNKPPGRPMDPDVREFMRFILSRDGQEIVARAGVYYPLTAAELQEQLRRLD
jgi:phosphate transport system substrate-binding protein